MPPPPPLHRRQRDYSFAGQPEVHTSQLRHQPVIADRAALQPRAQRLLEERLLEVAGPEVGHARRHLQHAPRPEAARVSRVTGPGSTPALALAHGEDTANTPKP